MASLIELTTLNPMVPTDINTTKAQKLPLLYRQPVLASMSSSQDKEQISLNACGSLLQNTVPVSSSYTIPKTVDLLKLV